MNKRLGAQLAKAKEREGELEKTLHSALVGAKEARRRTEVERRMLAQVQRRL